MVRKILTVEYSVAFIMYWITNAVFLNFASVYLLPMGYTNSDIGIILAIVNGVNIIFQPLLADISDRSKRISVIGVAEVSACVMMVFGLGLFVLKKKSLLLGLIFCVIVVWNVATQPLLNSLSRKLGETGEHINYGICRGFGSFGFAVFCAFFGAYIETRGHDVIPAWGELSLVLFLVSLMAVSFSFKCAMKKKTADGKMNGIVTNIEEETESINIVQFCRRNKLFICLYGAIVVMYFQYNILNSFLLQICEGVGGKASDMGMLFSVMAFLELPGLFFYDKIRTRFSVGSLLKFASCMYTMKIGIMAVAESMTMIYVGGCFQAVSYALFLPGMVEFINVNMSKGEAVKGQSFFTACITLSGVIASIIGGYMLDAYGPKLTLFVSLALTVVGSALVIFFINRINALHRS